MMCGPLSMPGRWTLGPTGTRQAGGRILGRSDTLSRCVNRCCAQRSCSSENRPGGNQDLYAQKEGLFSFDSLSPPSQRSLGTRGPSASTGATMRAGCLLLLSVPVLLFAQQLDVTEDYGPQQPISWENYVSEIQFPDIPELDSSSQQQVILEPEAGPSPTEMEFQTEPTEPGPFDCREEQYPCTRLYSVHKPCRQCLKSLCFYSLRRVYVVNKEVCVRTVCAHEELLRADLCRDQFSRCGVVALTGQCGIMGRSCLKSCRSC
ncbi:microfibrillar-associated protein 2-like [Anguilla anguilla]|uniref:microfibrillar-associated protein 2-like n=1 Tax=Anguilla anguilla TaxID=7936 RepID=UPI0015B19446|nr:microfibrillar-associated protein 2-like [Anguilla anguilla]